VNVQDIVDEFETADEHLTDVLAEVEQRLGGDLWDTLMAAIDGRRQACTAARNAVKRHKKPVGAFQVQIRGANTWNHQAVVALAKKRQELDELVELGVVVQKFDPKAAQKHLSDAAFGIYKDDCHEFIKGASIAIKGPKPEESILF